jgi:hypothetical protein
LPLDDEQIERYSRQLILPEVGPGGQERLAAARIAVIGAGVAAERAVAYLAAAGVGWIAAAPELHRHVDEAQADVVVVPLAMTGESPLDVAVVTAARIDVAAAAVAAWRGRAAQTVWIAEGMLGGSPPCPACGASALAASKAPSASTAVRDALLGTIAATEVVKSLLAIGVPIAGRALAYDPLTAAVTTADVAVRPSCACARLSSMDHA